MLPIPVRYLNDSITVRQPDLDSDYDGEYLDPITIEHVRYEGVESLNPNAYKLSDGAKGRIWIDAANSIGAIEIAIGSKVCVERIGDQMRVLTCAPYLFGGAIHHWEVDVG